MSGSINPTALDAALGWVRDNTTRLNLDSSHPTTSTEANSTYALGTLAWGTASWSITDGTTSGRQLTATAGTVPILTSGTVTHLSFTNAGTVCFVGTCVPVAVTSGGTIVVSSWDVEGLA